MLALYGDVADDSGTLRPWRGQGGILEMPAREVLALRHIRAAWADERRREADKRAREAKARR